MNVGQEYIDGGDRFATWRDTHLRLTGQAVAALEKLFAARWFEHTKKSGGENLFAAGYMPAPDPEAVANGTLIEVAAQGVEDPWSAARRTHMVAIGQAEESVWIQSPYFIPDYSIYDVMINAALSGIDVRFMMTGIPDKPIALWAAQTYYRKLIEAGARVFLYEAGFLHAKTIVVDHTRERRGYHEHGPAQPQAAQRDDGVGVRQGLRRAGRRPVRRRRDELP